MAHTKFPAKHSVLNQNMSYVDQSTSDICKKRSDMVTAEPSTYDMFLCWFLIREIKSCHMLIAQPSTYDSLVGWMVTLAL